MSIPNRKHFACTYCGKKYTKNKIMEKEFDECCPGPDGLACIPDGKERNPKQDLKGCEKYRQAFSLIEVAMNCEMGLYLQFDVENGIPKNCPGLEDFTTENFPIGNRTVALDVNCPLNMRSDDGDSPVSSIMAEYAADQVSQLTTIYQPIKLFSRISGLKTSSRLSRK